MYLQSKSKRMLVLSMPWLLSGPYCFEPGQMCEVREEDAVRLLAENPRLFSRVDKEWLPEVSPGKEASLPAPEEQERQGAAKKPGTRRGQRKDA